MKKVALSLVVLFAAAMVSCGGNKENTTEPAGDTTVTEETVDSTVVDSTVVDSDSPAVGAPVDTTVQK